MKKIFLSLLIITVTTSLFSCNEQPKEEKEFDALMTKIIGVHDEVMPKMGEMSSLIKKLEAKVDTTATGKKYAAAQEDVKGAYDFMMEWMGDFSKKFPHNEEVTSDNKEVFDTKMEMLKEEEVEVNELKTKINNSIENAKKLLGES
ncbi:hypothetical protein GCM10022393_30180 [Aquimarina addita]|uniref:Viral A-type inclusion protein n=1 Tax=Aquimarina addita TaxID=870485 RepID=A0ABP6UR89_9FLAO